MNHLFDIAFQQIKLHNDSTTKTRIIKLRKNSFSPAVFLPNDRYKSYTDYEAPTGWQSVAKCIARHSNNGTMSSLVEELRRNKQKDNPSNQL